MQTIAIANQKGGVGKTTTAVNLLSCIALAGYRCLLIDLDPQGNATSAFGRDRLEAPSLSGGLPEPVSTDVALLDLIPSSPTYGSPAVAEALGEALLSLPGDRYDYAVFDCPPALAGVTRSALAGSRSIIIPIQCEFFSLEGLDAVLRAVSTVQRQENPDLRILGILMTMYEPSQEYCNNVVDEIQESFSGQVFDTLVPRDVALSEAASFGQPVTVYAPRSQGCLAHVRLAKEVLHECGPTAG